MDWEALKLTAKLAALTSLILLFLGAPLAFWLARTRMRFKFLVEALVALPILLPPTVLGFYLLMATGPRTGFGRFLESTLGHPLPFSFMGILVGSTLYNLPFAVRPFVAAFAGVDKKLIEASWSLGVSKFETFFRTILPLSWGGILTGMVLTFAHTIGEFGVVLMVGGNIPEVTRTLSITIYDDVQALNYGRAQTISLILLGFAFTVLSCVYGLQKKVPNTV